MSKALPIKKLRALDQRGRQKRWAGSLEDWAPFAVACLGAFSAVLMAWGVISIWGEILDASPLLASAKRCLGFTAICLRGAAFLVAVQYPLKRWPKAKETLQKIAHWARVPIGVLLGIAALSALGAVSKAPGNYGTLLETRTGTVEVRAGGVVPHWGTVVWSDGATTAPYDGHLILEEAKGVEVLLADDKWYQVTSWGVVGDNEKSTMISRFRKHAPPQDWLVGFGTVGAIVRVGDGRDWNYNVSHRPVPVRSGQIVQVAKNRVVRGYFATKVPKGEKGTWRIRCLLRRTN